MSAPKRPIIEPIERVAAIVAAKNRAKIMYNFLGLDSFVWVIFMLAKIKAGVR